MAAMKPRTGDGPMEVTKEGRSLILRLPLEGGKQLVVEMNEKDGGRHQTFTVENEDLVQAETINELRVR